MKLAIVLIRSGMPIVQGLIAQLGQKLLVEGDEETVVRRCG